MRHILLVALVGCSGDDDGKDEAPPPPDDTDADTDADTDTDTDADTDTDTDTEPPPLTGPITPGLYVTYPVFVYYVDGVPPPPEPVSSGETGVVPVDITAVYLRWDAMFGYDGNGHVLETNINGDPLPSQLTVYYGTAAWAATNWSLDDVDQYCTVIVPLAGGTLAPWVAYTQRLWWGTESVGGQITGTCGTALSPVDMSAVGDPIVDWQGRPGMGVAVGGLRQEVVDEIGEALGDNLPFAFGAQFRIDPHFGQDLPIDLAYGFVYQVDLATGSLVINPFNDLVLILADDVYPYP